LRWHEGRNDVDARTQCALPFVRRQANPLAGIVLG
jgi:hypothetical protein